MIKRLTIPSVSHLSHVHTNTILYHPNVFRQRGYFYVFYTALLLDIENNSTHIIHTQYMEKLLEQSPDTHTHTALRYREQFYTYNNTQYMEKLLEQLLIQCYEEVL